MWFFPPLAWEDATFTWPSLKHRLSAKKPGCLCARMWSSGAVFMKGKSLPVDEIVTLGKPLVCVLAIKCFLEQYVTVPKNILLLNYKYCFRGKALPVECVRPFIATQWCRMMLGFWGGVRWMQTLCWQWTTNQHLQVLRGRLSTPVLWRHDACPWFTRDNLPSLREYGLGLKNSHNPPIIICPAETSTWFAGRSGGASEASLFYISYSRHLV